MPQHLYLSTLPEALIFSMLPPTEFGKYMAIGDKKLSSANSIFFELDPDIEIPGLNIQVARERCVPHKDGSPRRSAYVSIYRAFERIPLSAFSALHLTTKDGLVLSLQSAEYSNDDKVQKAYLYQEICPVVPRVVSNLGPREFCQYVTHVDNPLFLPKMLFADMKLGALANDPDSMDGDDLPYLEMKHLRSCLADIQSNSGGNKKSKVVRRGLRADIIFFMIENGFYVGDQDDFLYYPMPSEDALLGKHHRWWNSAMKVERY
ncbi:MAG: hypothetical protein AAGH40_03145 [Verrucomicrobiota bacterium]